MAVKMETFVFIQTPVDKILVLCLMVKQYLYIYYVSVSLTVSNASVTEGVQYTIKRLNIFICRPMYSTTYV